VRPGTESVWSATFGQSITILHLLPFSLRTGFRWADRYDVIRNVNDRIGRDFQVEALSFDELGLRQLPDSYSQRYGGWLQITPPPRYTEGMQERQQRILRDFRRSCPKPRGQPTVAVLISPSGLGAIRLVREAQWNSRDDLEALHESQTEFIHSYFKIRARDPRLADDLLALLAPIREGLLALPYGADDARHHLTVAADLKWPVSDFFVALVHCAATANARQPPAWPDLLAAPEIECITGHSIDPAEACVLTTEALLVVGWDESLLAFAGRPSESQEADRRNALALFSLGAMHWGGLYDADQLLYGALPYLFAKGRGFTKLQLIRGVQAHLAELQHESKVAFLAEHEDGQKLLSQMFDSWETENLSTNLDKKSTMLTAIVDRLNDERLREVGVFFTVLSLVGIVSNLGVSRAGSRDGWIWSGVAIVIALVGWLLLRWFSRR
jgi:hypothetical protein